MTPPPTDGGILTVVIVNYNGLGYLGDCLGALRRQTLPRHRYEVVLIDNGSRDGSAAFVGANFPEVHLIEAGRNLGFAGGNNRAAAAAHGRRLVLLNNDTVADPHWLERLDRASREHPGAMVASKLVFHAEAGRLNSSGLRLLRDGRGTDTGFRAADDGRFETPGETWAGCGAALLLRHDPAEGPPFDERFFMYYEDLDLAWRGRLRGLACRYEPAALVSHVHCGSSGEWSPFFTFHVERNRALTALRNADLFLAVWSVLGLGARVGRSVTRWLASGCRREAGAVSLAHLKAMLSFLRHAVPVTLDRYRQRRGWL